MADLTKGTTVGGYSVFGSGMPGSAVTLVPLAVPGAPSVAVVSPPSGALSLSAVADSSSTLAATTYYVDMAYGNASGYTTVGSSQASITLSTADADSISFSAVLPVDVTEILVGMGTASGGEGQYASINSGAVVTYEGGNTTGVSASVSGSTLTVTITAPPTSTSTAMPSTNTANINGSGSAAGSSLASGTTYYYGTTAIAADGKETNLGPVVSWVEGSTAYPITLNLQTVGEAAALNIYKGTSSSVLDFLAQTTLLQYTDSGDVATTSTVPPLSNETAQLNAGGVSTFGDTATIEEALLGYDAVTGTINSQIQQVDGDLWLTANALYDASTGDWNRVDTSKSAFALQIQGNNNIPGLTTPGTIIWTAAPGTNPIGAFLAEGGWVNAGIFASNQNMIVGGINLEVDGSGNAPYSRINQLQGVGTYFSRNAFYNGSSWEFDDTSLPASALAILQDGTIQLLSAPAGTTVTWDLLSSVNEVGLYTVTSLAIGSSITQIAQQTTYGNYGVPTVVAGSTNLELTATTATQIFSFTPPIDGMYTVKCYLRVVTASTTVTVTIAYDDSGGAQTYTPAALNAQSLAVGSYSMVDYSFEATGSAAITLTVTAGTANQVYVTSALEGVS